MMGKTVLQTRYDLQAGGNTLACDVTALSAGMYSVKIKSDAGWEMRKIIKQ